MSAVTAVTRSLSQALVLSDVSDYSEVSGTTMSRTVMEVTVKSATSTIDPVEAQAPADALPTNTDEPILTPVSEPTPASSPSPEPVTSDKDDNLALYVTLADQITAALALNIADLYEGCDPLTGTVPTGGSVLTPLVNALAAITDRKVRREAVAAAIAPLAAKAASDKDYGFVSRLTVVQNVCQNASAARVSTPKPVADPAHDVLTALMDLWAASQYVTEHLDATQRDRVSAAILTGDPADLLALTSSARVARLVTAVIPRTSKGTSGSNGTGGTKTRTAPAVALPDGMSGGQAHVHAVVTALPVGGTVTVADTKRSPSVYWPNGLGNVVDNIGHPGGTAHDGYKPLPAGVTRSGNTFTHAGA